MTDPAGTPVDASADFATGIAIAHDLASSAVWSGEVCAFHGAAPAASLGLPALHRSFGGDYYEGSAGIARFLALAAKLADDAGIGNAALGAMRHALAQTTGWSLFAGRLGTGLVALEVAEWLDRPELVQPAVAVIEMACSEALDAAANGAPCDLLSGLAGVIHGLTAARAYDLDGSWLTAAIKLAQAVAEQAHEDWFGLS